MLGPLIPGRQRCLGLVAQSEVGALFGDLGMTLNNKNNLSPELLNRKRKISVQILI